LKKWRDVLRKKKILTVVGARPQFVKAAVVSRCLAADSNFEECIVHTGQHYDAGMSDIFFEELEIPRPHESLGIGGGSHGQNTGRMLEAVEQVIKSERPDWVLVYGDTDSTLAGALAAVKLHVPIAHVEAGLRSFNRRMPEEINRVLTDHASTLLFAPTKTAVQNLAAEGIKGPSVALAGDVMYDAALFYAAKAQVASTILSALKLSWREFTLATIHRPVNTDNPEMLRTILSCLGSSGLPVIFPMHPRTRIKIKESGISIPTTVRIIEPVGYLDMVQLERHARLIVTDSGGVQKEAYFHSIPCVTVREETEWTELLECGANRLVGTDWDALRRWVSTDIPEFPKDAPADLYGDGRSGLSILDSLRALD
jgi:UDP-GlcNAc3NAcA epimerase